MNRLKKMLEPIRSHWIPIVLALIICAATAIVVPIIYSVRRVDEQGTKSKLSWANQGQTLIGPTTIIDGTSRPLGDNLSLTIDISRNVYIVDRSNNRILKFDKVSVRVHLGDPEGRPSTDNSSFNQPFECVIDQNSTMFVVDTMNHRVQMFLVGSKQGETLLGQAGEPGSDEQHLNSPTSITLNSKAALIYVSDYGNHRIIELNLNSRRKRTFFDSTSTQTRNSFIRHAISIRFDDQTQSIYIGQQFSYNVVQWSTNQTFWTVVAGSENSDLNGTSRTLFNPICSIVIDQYADLYVADCWNQRIQYFFNRTRKGRTIAGVIQASGSSHFLFNSPTSIDFDRDDNFYVADSLNRRIQFFKKL